MIDLEICQIDLEICQMEDCGDGNPSNQDKRH